MSVIIATGGLDEMAIDFTDVVQSGIFLAVAILTGFAWWKHSLVAAIVTFILILLDGVIIQRWLFVASRPLIWPYDQTWQLKMRVISVVWLLIFILTLVNLTRAVLYTKAAIDAHNVAQE